MADSKNPLPNTFVLFKNVRTDAEKEGKKRPNYVGYCYDSNGKKYKINGWIRKRGNGDSFIAGTFVDMDTDSRRVHRASLKGSSKKPDLPF